ncbi:hypothetical protein BC936DRAFT_145204 [Jimgerdemannia flammicorona]|uniref:Peroxin/Ferlin domain-containing protein n=1 Tax=Jimgerdemannia flammicorona TaxID=994334 RepID=A0A433DAN8_9FUNG|nr:hypothetical protein BC936DRAFT_145204 [Jimgerdemannia flammicorona]
MADIKAPHSTSSHSLNPSAAPSPDYDFLSPMPSVKTTSPSTSATTRHQPSTQAIDFLTSTPAPITRLLTYVGPIVHLLAYLIKLITWQGNPSESLLFIATWWSLCLFGHTLFVYGLPPAFAAWIAWEWVQRGRRERLGRPHPHAAATSSNDLNTTVIEIQQIVDHLAVFRRSRLGFRTTIDWSSPAETRLLLNVIFLFYVPWLVLNWLVGTSIIFLVAGTIALTWASPWARVVRMALARSSLIKYAVRSVVSYVIALASPHSWRGSYSVQKVLQKAGEHQLRLLTEWKDGPEAAQQTEAGEKEEKENAKQADLVFRFTTYENQRWWLGLEWTTNMLPNDRPPWSDDRNEPTPPKHRFTLPPATRIILPHPSDPTLVMRRTTHWTWLDDDWHVTFRDRDVDKQGWEYGDNQWHHFGPKQGLRAYTRRRIWTRAARLEEINDVVPRDEAGRPVNEDGAIVIEKVEDEEDEEMSESGKGLRSRKPFGSLGSLGRENSDGGSEKGGEEGEERWESEDVAWVKFVRVGVTFGTWTIPFVFCNCLATTSRSSLVTDLNRERPI